jgi:hypothetical protein
MENVVFIRNLYKYCKYSYIAFKLESPPNAGGYNNRLLRKCLSCRHTDKFKTIYHVKYVLSYTHISSTLVNYKTYSSTDTSKYAINK